MQKEILINADAQEKRVAVVEGGVLEEYYIERPSEVSIVGNIYKGVVDAIMPGIEAAFVNIGSPRNGFLYIRDFVDGFDLLESGPRRDLGKLKKGQKLVVQVVKEPMGSKGARLTTHIGIAGRFVVFMPYDHHIGLSKKITDRKERERLRKILKKIMPDLSAGLIVRTAGFGRFERDFKREIKYLRDLWRKIERYANKVTVPSIIHEEQGLSFRVVRDIFSEDTKRVLVDSREEYKRLRNFSNIFMPEMKRKLMLYRERVSLFESRGIEKAIESLYRKKIPLECGGGIVIEETEGLVAIDVNSGTFTRQHIEDTAFKVNSEASREIARQIRLRDIGGIIIIDFIDMDSRSYRDKIFNILIDSFKKDKAKIKILRMSEFGIVQLTRQRIRRGVRKVSYKNCPYCSGRGSVKSAVTMSIEVLRHIKKNLEKKRAPKIYAYVHPEVCNYMLNEDRSTITELESRYRTKVVVIAEPQMHMENYRIA